ncbi:MAG TPA: alkaline phosphatase family protein [Balneolaceae bacterium]
MSVIFLFIDGVGLGEEFEANPFSQSDYPGFSSMSGGRPFTKNAAEIIEKDHVFKPVDAALGVEGLPQSGTGQATLFSGNNASKVIGKHFGPFPHSGIKHLLNEESLFGKAQKLGKSCQFLNAYPDIFFKRAKRRKRWTCTTLMTQKAGMKLNSTEEIKKGEALTAEITQEAWRKRLNADVPQISPEKAAKRLLNQAKKFDLLLHEYYLTDKAGHARDMKKAAEYLTIYGRFLEYLIQQKPEEVTIVLSSDHGNVEDLSTKTHSLNKVPLFAIGPGAHHFAKAESIMDVTPGILKVLEG